MSITKFFLIAILVTGYLVVSEIELFDEIIELPQETEAKCLDGSPYTLKLIRGFGDGSDKFLIQFDPGAWCGYRGNSVLDDCEIRSKTELGKNEYSYSSLFYVSKNSKFYSRKQNENPEFYNWNKLFLKYCDGTGFFGYKKDPVKVKNSTLYFRGYNNTLGSLDYLKKNFKLTNNSRIMIFGLSSGGLASLYWSNFIADYFKGLSVFTVVDSGIFLGYENKIFKKDIMNHIWEGILEQVDETKPMLETFCNLNETVKCFSPENFIQNIKVPLMIIHNEYDSWSIKYLLGETCHFHPNLLNNCNQEERQRIEDLRSKSINFISQATQSKPNWGAWVPSAVMHVYILTSEAFHSDDYMVNQTSLQESVQNWYKSLFSNTDEEIVLIDKNIWPGNEKIAYKKDNYYYMEYQQHYSQIKLQDKNLKG